MFNIAGAQTVMDLLAAPPAKVFTPAEQTNGELSPVEEAALRLCEKICPPNCCKKKATTASYTNVSETKNCKENKACAKICPPKCCKGNNAKEATMASNVEDSPTVLEKICKKVCPPNCCKGTKNASSAKLANNQDNKSSKSCSKATSKTCCKKDINKNASVQLAELN